MNALFLGIVIFLIVLAVFDLVIGVSNDAVNFLNSAIGAKVTSFKKIVLIAAIGVFVGAAFSNGMMDVARHGIMNPTYFTFYDVICVCLAVMITDVILLDIFNTLGMPTSTTVSMVFELLGGAFAIAIVKIAHGALDANGIPLTLGDLLNTEKAISVILGIFLSVAIAFMLGLFVQWVARLIFSFTYRVNGVNTDAKHREVGLFSSSIKIGIFSGTSIISIVWFLLINGFKGASFMTPDIKALIMEYQWVILGGGWVFFSILMTGLSMLKLPVLKFVVLLGTFALAMAFAGNDLVNFVGVPLTGLESYQDFMSHGAGDAQAFYMHSLNGTAQTPTVYLIIAGVIMVLALIFSRKAQNVVKTSVDLSRQDEGDEMFGSSSLARIIVRSSQHATSGFSRYIPKRVQRWIDSRFNANEAVLTEGAAFDLIRASVNLVLAGILVAFGTSMKLPLSTTYVTFMVAMGTSLADRAWSRESAVFRITGVISVIGGWFVTAGIAFMLSYMVCNAFYFGSFPAMIVAIIIATFLLFRSHMKYQKNHVETDNERVYHELVRTQEPSQRWDVLHQYVLMGLREQLTFSAQMYGQVVDGFFNENYSPLKHAVHAFETDRKQLKRQRRREIIALRKCDPMIVIDKSTWYFLANSSMMQLLFCLKRINDPCCEHVGNNFHPVDKELVRSFEPHKNHIISLFDQAIEVLNSPELDKNTIANLREHIEQEQRLLGTHRDHVIDKAQQQSTRIESTIVYLNIVQESQQMLSYLRHLLRGIGKFSEYIEYA